MKKDGKELEELVKLIEESIDPDCRIEHDVNLPVLNSQIGSTTQCDIVAIKGIKPRETITIFEVQDRSKPVDANTFRGWMTKLEETGAQHLICVSKHPFTASIKERAQQSGTKISLIHFSDSDPSTIPLNFLNFYFDYSETEITTIENLNVELYFTEEELAIFNEKGDFDVQIGTKDEIFSRDKKNMLDLYDLTRENISHKSSVFKQKYPLSIDSTKEAPFFVLRNGQFYESKITGTVVYDFVVTNVPTSIISYVQLEHGPMAWVWEAKFKTNKGDIWIKTPIVPHGDHYRLGRFIGNLPEGVNLSLLIATPKK